MPYGQYNGLLVPFTLTWKNLVMAVNGDAEKHIMAHLQSSVFKLSKDLIDSIHEEGIVAYTS